MNKRKKKQLLKAGQRKMTLGCPKTAIILYKDALMVQKRKTG